MFLCHQLIKGQQEKKKDPKSEQIILNKTSLDRRHQIVISDPLLHLGLCMGKTLSPPRVIKNTVICPGSYLTRTEPRFAQRSYILSV